MPNPTGTYCRRPMHYSEYILTWIWGDHKWYGSFYLVVFTPVWCTLFYEKIVFFCAFFIVLLFWSFLWSVIFDMALTFSLLMSLKQRPNIEQDCHATWKTRKNQGIWKLTGKLIKLTDWQSPLEKTSQQCWKQNVSNSGLESHTCDFSMNSRKYANYLFFNSRKSAYRSTDYRGIPRSLKFLIAKLHKTLICQFQIFGFADLMVIF